MKTRRDFLITGAAAMTALTTAGLAGGVLPARAEATLQPPPGAVIKPRKISRALAAWYSQTGNTGRMGRYIAAQWRKKGIKVISGDIREIGPVNPESFDLIAVGAPVNYYDAPPPLYQWLSALPQLGVKPACAFATNGVPAGNPYNTCVRILEGLAAKGCFPVGLDNYDQLTTYPPSWAWSPERVLKLRHLPDQAEYGRAAAFAAACLERAEQGAPVEVEMECTLYEVKRVVLTYSLNKMLVSDHYIDTGKCVQCGACVEKCPVGAIDLSSGKVNTSACQCCMACINNCPAGAVNMVYLTKKLEGLLDFRKQYGIKLLDPTA